MNKILYGALLALGVCGIAAIAYDEGKMKGYANGIRDGEKKSECQCETCKNQKLCNELESEGEPIKGIDKPVKAETEKPAENSAASDDGFEAYKRQFMD